MARVTFPDPASCWLTLLLVLVLAPKFFFTGCSGFPPSTIFFNFNFREYFNLIPRLFDPYCVGLTKQATLKSSVAGWILTGFMNNRNGPKENAEEFRLSHAFESYLGMTNSTGSLK